MKSLTTFTFLISRRLLVTLTTLVLAAPGYVAAVSAADEPLAPRLEGVGNVKFEITTTDPAAQRFFNQGIALAYAFNHAEAIRAFKEAARLDPSAPMPHWGEALALGSNLNDPAPPERRVQAFEALERAKGLAESASYTTDKEKALMEALESRYSPDPEADAELLDIAYRNAMRSLWTRFRDDGHVGTLYAAAIMNTMPWDYWTQDQQPRARTMRAREVLETVMQDHPEHTGAHHYYIHLVEASKEASLGVPSADVLGDLAPSAGHLVHMPSHIYIRVGEYEKAADANRKAILADEDYIAQCQAQGLYPVGYYPHNIHFLWASATLFGGAEEAIAAALKTAEKVPLDQAGEIGFMQGYLATPYFAWVRFGRWDDILAAAEPSADLIYTRGIWHYARAIAFAARDEHKQARRELKLLQTFARNPGGDDLLISFTPASTVLELAANVADGELWARRGKPRRALDPLARAVEIEDGLRYSEPPTWHHPVRQILGAVLLQLEEHAEAERIYREDLENHPNNGWSLFGLAESLLRQGKQQDYQAAEEQFAEAWARADVSLRGSRF